MAVAAPWRARMLVLTWGRAAGRGASWEEVRRSYKDGTRKWHPDGHGPGQQSEATREFLRVSKAYERLCPQYPECLQR